MAKTERREFSPTFYAALAIVCAFLVIVLSGTAAFVITSERIADNAAAQQQASQLLESNLCHSLNSLKALKPPPGNAQTNPSRAFEQAEHMVLAGLAADVGCPSIPATGK